MIFQIFIFTEIVILKTSDQSFIKTKWIFKFIFEPALLLSSIDKVCLDSSK